MDRASIGYERYRGGGAAAAGVPGPLCETLRHEWQRRPVDRQAALEALAACARWLRDAGLRPEQVLLGIKQLLPIRSGPADDELATHTVRSVLLGVTMAVYHGTDDPETLLRLWPKVERRTGAPHPARASARLLRDPTGEEWRVYERLDRRGTPEDETCLIFESAQCMRRVRTYPADWRNLPNRELLRLVGSAR